MPSPHLEFGHFLHFKFLSCIFCDSSKWHTQIRKESCNTIFLIKLFQFSTGDALPKLPAHRDGRNGLLRGQVSTMSQGATM